MITWWGGGGRVNKVGEGSGSGVRGRMVLIYVMTLCILLTFTISSTSSFRQLVIIISTSSSCQLLSTFHLFISIFTSNLIYFTCVVVTFYNPFSSKSFKIH